MPGTIRISDRHDTAHNLALEETAMAHLAPDEWSLLFWTGEQAVVIGKHQNPWAECRLPALQAEGIVLARRITGGGAVYHDPGNLNYTFILNRDAYDRDAVQAVALEAVCSLGIAATIGQRQTLLVGGRKISGTAFCYRGQRVLHHGTLLIDVDLERLHRYLIPTERVETSRAIASVPSPVMNLREVAPVITGEAVIEAFCAAASVHFGDAHRPSCALDGLPEEEVQTASVRHREWAWIYGNTPRFQLTATTSFAWGSVTLHLEIHHGIIHHLTLETPSMGLQELAAAALEGCRFDAAAMGAALRREAVITPQLNDLAGWLEHRHQPAADQHPRKGSPR